MEFKQDTELVQLHMIMLLPVSGYSIHEEEAEAKLLDLEALHDLFYEDYKMMQKSMTELNYDGNRDRGRNGEDESV